MFEYFAQPNMKLLRSIHNIFNYTKCLLNFILNNMFSVPKPTVVRANFVKFMLMDFGGHVYVSLPVKRSTLNKKYGSSVNAFM